MKKPPAYFYPLYEKWDKDTFKTLLNKAKNIGKIRVITNQNETNRFFRNVIISQKSAKWRYFFKIILRHLKLNKLDLAKINKEAKDMPYKRGVDKWAFFEQDKELCRLVDIVSKQKTNFSGSSRNIAEFIIRYILAQLLQDWRGPKMALLLITKGKKKVKVTQINKILSTWDFTNIFQ